MNDSMFVSSSPRRSTTKTARKEHAVMRALRKIARLGAAAGRRARVAAKRLAQMTKVAAAKAAHGAKRVATKVAQVAAPAARVLARPFLAAARAAHKGYRTIADSKLGDIARRGWATIARTWRTALRPFLKEWGLVFSATAWVTSLMVAPLTTTVVTGAAGLLALALSKALAWLEGSNSRLARITRNVIEGLAQLARVAFYACSGLLVTLMAAVSLPFAVLCVTELTLRTMGWRPFEKARNVVATATATVVDADEMPVMRVRPRAERAPITPRTGLDVPAMKRRQKIEVVKDVEVVEPVVVTVMPASPPSMPKAPPALGAEEMSDLPTCDACSSFEGPLHAKSHRREHDVDAEAWLCGDCYGLECEDDAIRFTGVSLTKVSTEVRLNKEGLAATVAHARSLVEDSVVWGGHPFNRDRDATMVWRDRNGMTHAREWSGFVRGEVVANVIHDYRRGTYRVLVMGKPPRHVAAQRDLVSAIQIASDLWNDAVLRLESEMHAPPAAYPVKRRFTAIKAV